LKANLHRSIIGRLSEISASKLIAKQHFSDSGQNNSRVTLAVAFPVIGTLIYPFFFYLPADRYSKPFFKFPANHLLKILFRSSDQDIGRSLAIIPAFS